MDSSMVMRSIFLSCLLITSSAHAGFFGYLYSFIFPKNNIEQDIKKDKKNSQTWFGWIAQLVAFGYWNQGQQADDGIKEPDCIKKKKEPFKVHDIICSFDLCKEQKEWRTITKKLLKQVVFDKNDECFSYDTIEKIASGIQANNLLFKENDLNLKEDFSVDEEFIVDLIKQKTLLKKILWDYVSNKKLPIWAIFFNALKKNNNLKKEFDIFAVCSFDVVNLDEHVIDFYTVMGCDDIYEKLEYHESLGYLLKKYPDDMKKTYNMVKGTEKDPLYMDKYYEDNFWKILKPYYKKDFIYFSDESYLYRLQDSVNKDKWLIFDKLINLKKIVNNFDAGQIRPDMTDQEKVKIQADNYKKGLYETINMLPKEGIDTIANNIIQKAKNAQEKQGAYLNKENNYINALEKLFYKFNHYISKSTMEGLKRLYSTDFQRRFNLFDSYCKKLSLESMTYTAPFFRGNLSSINTKLLETVFASRGDYNAQLDALNEFKKLMYTFDKNLHEEVVKEYKNTIDQLGRQKGMLNPEILSLKDHVTKFRKEIYTTGIFLGNLDKVLKSPFAESSIKDISHDINIVYEKNRENNFCL